MIAVFILITFENNNKNIMSKEKGVYTGIIEKDKNGNLELATKGLFEFSDEFIKDYLANREINKFPAAT